MSEVKLIEEEAERHVLCIGGVYFDSRLHLLESNFKYETAKKRKHSADEIQELTTSLNLGRQVLRVMSHIFVTGRPISRAIDDPRFSHELMNSEIARFTAKLHGLDEANNLTIPKADLSDARSKIYSAQLEDYYLKGPYEALLATSINDDGQDEAFESGFGRALEFSLEDTPTITKICYGYIGFSALTLEKLQTVSSL